MWETALPAGLVSLLSRKGQACLPGVLLSNKIGQAGDLSPPRSRKGRSRFPLCPPPPKGPSVYNSPVPGNCTSQLTCPLHPLSSSDHQHPSPAVRIPAPSTQHQAQHSAGESNRQQASSTPMEGVPPHLPTPPPAHLHPGSTDFYQGPTTS